MFTKLKAVWNSFIIGVSNGIRKMTIGSTIEGDVKTVEADAAAALKVAVADVEKVIGKVEAVMSPLVTNAATVSYMPPPASSATTAATSVISPTADAIILKVKDLMAIAEREATSFDAAAALAKKAVTGDVDAVLTKLKAILDYKGVATDVWDEIVAVAKS